MPERMFQMLLLMVMTSQVFNNDIRLVLNDGRKVWKEVLHSILTVCERILVVLLALTVVEKLYLFL